MSLQEDVEEIKMKADKLEKESLAFNIYGDYKAVNKRMFVIILVLLAYCAFITYKYIDTVSNYGYETITEISDTEGEGNAYVGDNCNNGVINGESS